MTADYTQVQTARLYEKIVEQIEGQVLEGKLHDGDRLPTERELAEKFGVSRTAVREAVKALREKGLVDSHPAGAPLSPTAPHVPCATPWVF